MLLEKGYKYLSLPSAGSWDVIEKQEVVTKELYLLSLNECFRNEQELKGLQRLREFKKLEQFCFCKKENADKAFNELLNNSIEFLKRHNIE